MAYGAVEAVDLLLGLFGQGAVEGQMQKAFEALARAAGAGREGGVGGWREGHVEQDLAAPVRVVGSDDIDGQPGAETMAQAVHGSVGGFGCHEGHQAGGIAVGRKWPGAGGLAEFGGLQRPGQRDLQSVVVPHRHLRLGVRAEVWGRQVQMCGACRRGSKGSHSAADSSAACEAAAWRGHR